MVAGFWCGFSRKLALAVAPALSTGMFAECFPHPDQGASNLAPQQLIYSNLPRLPGSFAFELFTCGIQTRVKH